MLFIRLFTFHGDSIAFKQLGEVYEELRSHLEAFHELKGGGQQKGGRDLTTSALFAIY